MSTPAWVRAKRRARKTASSQQKAAKEGLQTTGLGTDRDRDRDRARKEKDSVQMGGGSGSSVKC